jgi:hypothetical protein
MLDEALSYLKREKFDSFADFLAEASDFEEWPWEPIYRSASDTLIRHGFLDFWAPYPEARPGNFSTQFGLIDRQEGSELFRPMLYILEDRGGPWEHTVYPYLGENLLSFYASSEVNWLNTIKRVFHCFTKALNGDPSKLQAWTREILEGWRKAYEESWERKEGPRNSGTAPNVKNVTFSSVKRPKAPRQRPKEKPKV